MQAFLESFATVDEVYQECKKRGIKGVPCNSSQCAIAALVFDEYPDCKNDPHFVVDPRICSRTGFIRTSNTQFEMPTPLQKFALAFDEGQYPDLVKEPTNDR